MSKHVFKAGLAVVLALFASLLFIRGLGGLGTLLEHFSTGADPADVLRRSPMWSDGSDTEPRWLPDLPQPARDLEPATRLAVTDGYMRAWDDIAVGDADSAYLTGPAVAAGHGERTASEHIAHTMQLEFYSADGQLLVLSDVVGVLRCLEPAGGGLVVGQGVEHYRVIMLLEDGNWRVRTLHRLDVSDSTFTRIHDPRSDQRLPLATVALVVGVTLFIPGWIRQEDRAHGQATDKRERN